MELFKREDCLKRIRGFYHAADIIKVITGVRRCGKSSLMQILKWHKICVVSCLPG